MNAEQRAERFKNARLTYNKNGKEGLRAVEEKTGISQSLIWDLEAKTIERKVNYPTVVELANHYGVNVAWLLGQSNSPSLDESSQVVTKVTGLSCEVVETLQSLKPELINCLNTLMKTNGFVLFLKHFETALRIRNTSTQTDGVADMIENLSQWADDSNVPASGLRMSDRQMADLYLWKASQTIDNTCRELIKKGDQ